MGIIRKLYQIRDSVKNRTKQYAFIINLYFIFFYAFGNAEVRGHNMMRDAEDA
jgi:hypothetical protein